MTLYKCPHCGWQYDPSSYHVTGTHEPWDLVPKHDAVVAGNIVIECPGQQQKPRNAETDNRPLGKDEKP